MDRRTLIKKGRELTGAAAAMLVLNQAANANALADYAWSNRPVILYAPNRDDPGLQAQREVLLAHKQALAERDIVLIEVVDQEVETILGRSVPLSAADLRRQHGIGKSSSCIVLVGKDTGVKIRHFGQLTPEELFLAIDAMPMRQREMQRRDNP